MSHFIVGSYHKMLQRIIKSTLFSQINVNYLFKITFVNTSINKVKLVNVTNCYL